uniref:Uncharacterized protein n=1 Tax=Amphora coffeiformis TaxID=265554 RepID=A0A7S3L6I4_9STRA|mmetsp:Transcript_16766/g.33826  ORF Transcript_16766/g.33826 Transcript_16766/m.33826 type:complete len:144 (+) Transcript_16766:36-467(+)
MKTFSTVTLFAALVSTGNAWTVPSKEQLREAVTAGSVVASLVAAPLVSNALDFSGTYDDPNHPFCVREIENIGRIATIHGTDGNPGCSKNGKGNEFDLLAQVTDKEIAIDFTPKGGPEFVVAKWEGGEEPGIVFPDGNKWIRK